MRVDLIGFDSGWGCKDFGCEDGPGKISIDQILHCLTLSGVEARWHGPLGLKFLGSHEELNSKEKTLPVVIQCLNRLSKITKQSVENKNIPVVIGGDHSSAIGTWSGVISGAKAHQKFGLIWMDAHLDAHTYETSSQGKWGGGGMGSLSQL